MKAPVFRTKYEGSFSVAQVRCGFSQRVEHCLKMESRAADDPQHLGGRGLLLPRLIQFAC
jgi:hypothetical protein